MVRGFDRRRVLATGAAAGLVAGALGPAAASPLLDAHLAEILAGRTPRAGRITLDTPEVAENGAMVAIGIRVDSPMTEADHVRRIFLIAERNPRPAVATFHLTPQMGRAEVQSRIRLAETQTVVAIAETSDGELHRAANRVVVTIGGCG